jgi:hypothetical protein
MCDFMQVWSCKILALCDARIHGSLWRSQTRASSQPGPIVKPHSMRGNHAHILLRAIPVRCNLLLEVKKKGLKQSKGARRHAQRHRGVTCARDRGQQQDAGHLTQTSAPTVMMTVFALTDVTPCIQLTMSANHPASLDHSANFRFADEPRVSFQDAPEDVLLAIFSYLAAEEIHNLRKVSTSIL